MRRARVPPASNRGGAPLAALVLAGVLVGCLATACATTAGPPGTSEPRRTTEVYDLPCAYTARKDAPDLSEDQTDYNWGHYETCARFDRDGHLVMDPAHLERARLDEGFAEVLIDLLGWYYVWPDGASLHAINHDFAPDAWSEGLARGLREGRITYFNQRFEELTTERYDWGWPFENGRAMVCRGCVVEPLPGEHPLMVGGTWWYLDHAGAEVEREDLTDEEVARLDARSRMR